MAGIDHTALNKALLKGKAQWSPALNPITGLDDEARKRLLGVVVDRGEVAKVIAAAKAPSAGVAPAAPPAVDWRNVGGHSFVTAVKDQRNCGSCVSFCSCGTLESMAAIRKGATVDLSEADLHFCGGHGANCGGWWPSDALNELQSRGVPDEACFPYASAFDAAGNPSCHSCSDRNKRAWKITGQTMLSTMAQRKAWLASHGPVSGVFHVYNDFFSYHTGVYSHITGASAGYHCVEIIGYSDADGCWIAKNSWGPGWGDAGFFRIAYGQCGIDETSTDTDGSSINRFPMYGINDVVAPAPKPGWSGWEDLGGVIVSGAGAASWTANRLDVFATGTDNAMWHRWWDGSAWRGWESLGGVIDDSPAAVSWGPNRIDCFARGMDNALWHRWWDGSSWQGWESLGGIITSSPAVASWGANRLDVFAKGADNAMWHIWWDGSSWHGWESLGGVIDDGPAAVSWGPNRIDCFGRGTDSHLYHRWFDGTWHNWEDLGGIIFSGPAAASWQANRLDVFAKGTDNAMWHRWWDGAAWQGWESLGGVIDDNPGAVSWGPNRIDCFVRGMNNHLWHKWFA